MASLETVPTSKKEAALAERFNFVAPDQKIADQIREKHPDWPNIKLAIYFSAHDTKSDKHDIHQYIDSADVFLYENVPYEPEINAFFNEVSQNPQMSVEEYLDDERFGGPMRDTSLDPEIRSLYGSGKVVGSIDIGKDGEDEGLVSALDSPIYPEGGETFEQALDDFADGLKKYAQTQNGREEKMVANFEGEIERIFESNPGLKDKNELSILLAMGADHTRLGHLFTAHGYEPKRHFSGNGTFYYGELDEVVRMYNWGKQPSRELLQKAYANALIQELVATASHRDEVPSQEQTMYAKYLTSRLQDVDIKTFYQLINNGRLSVSSMNGILARRGVNNVARTRQGVESVNDNTYNRAKKATGKVALKDMEVISHV